MRRVDECTQEAVDAHGGDGFCVAFRGEGGGEDGEDRVAESRGEFIQTETFIAEEEFRIRPGAPFRTVYMIA